MSELIGIREAARRLGVSDTAVHKAIKAGRVTVAGRTEKSDRPLLSWPECRDDWLANSADHKRTHVGGTGKSPRRKEYDTEQPEVALTLANKRTADKPQSAATAALMTYNDARAARENYQAELARIEVEEKSGRLVEREEVKAEAFKVARSVRDAILNIPDRVSHELAHETDPTAVHMRLTAELRTALEGLAGSL